jgi:hypothetical protein
MRRQQPVRPQKMLRRIIWYAQQLLVHRPCDVGQDARPIHNGLFAPIPCGGDRPKMDRNASDTAMLAVNN